MPQGVPHPAKGDKDMMRLKWFAALVLIALLFVGTACDTGGLIGQSIDVSFRNGSHQQYDGVTSWNTVHEGLFSNTVDIHFWHGKVTRLHYVTSIRVIR